MTENNDDEIIETEIESMTAKVDAEEAKEIAEEAKEIAEEAKKDIKENEGETSWLKNQLEQMQTVLTTSELQQQKLIVMCENQELRLSELKKLLVQQPSKVVETNQETIVSETAKPEQQKKEEKGEDLPEARKKPVKLI